MEMHLEVEYVRKAVPSYIVEVVEKLPDELGRRRGLKGKLRV